jgi:hypothetical protein
VSSASATLHRCSLGRTVRGAPRRPGHEPGSDPGASSRASPLGRRSSDTDRGGRGDARGPRPGRRRRSGQRWRRSVELGAAGMSAAHARVRAAAAAIEQDRTFAPTPSERCGHCPWLPSCTEGAVYVRTGSETAGTEVGIDSEGTHPGAYWSIADGEPPRSHSSRGRRPSVRASGSGRRRAPPPGARSRVPRGAGRTCRSWRACAAGSHRR